MPNPERLPEEEIPNNSIRKLAGEMKKKVFSPEEMQLAKESAIRVLDQIVDPDEPILTIKEVRALLDRELDGVSLSKLIMDDRELGY